MRRFGGRRGIPVEITTSVPTAVRNFIRCPLKKSSKSMVELDRNMLLFVQSF